MYNTANNDGPSFDTDYSCRSIAFGARNSVVHSAKINGVVCRNVKRNFLSSTFIPVHRVKAGLVGFLSKLSYIFPVSIRQQSREASIQAQETLVGAESGLDSRPRKRVGCTQAADIAI